MKRFFLVVALMAFVTLVGCGDSGGGPKLANPNDPKLKDVGPAAKPATDNSKPKAKSQ
jgi:hypothetical protein